MSFDTMTLTPNELNAIQRKAKLDAGFLGVIGDPKHPQFMYAIAGLVWVIEKRDGSTEAFEAYLDMPLGQLMDRSGLDTEDEDEDAEGR